MIGKKLRAYEITEEIGSGGMATVFRAYQPSMDRHVAIKVIRSTILHDPDLRERFQREARLIARLEHPHLLPVYDFDGEHDPPFIVMRYLEGGTLKQVQAQGRVPRDEFLYILRQLAGALDYAHRQSVVHRDLKPSNVMIDREGNAFLTDFGIARAAGGDQNLTGTGIMIGTPGYMAPEQARADGVADKAADIYSLGVIAFEVLTGSPPYEHENGFEVILAHINSPIPKASERETGLPKAIDPVLAKALAKDKTERYPTATEFVEALTRALKIKPSEAPAALQSMTQTISVDQLSAHRRKKDESETPGPDTPSDQQRQMTAVSIDMKELAEILYEKGADAERARSTMDAVWSALSDVAKGYGGVTHSRTEETGLILWGRDRAREDDSENAIRAALAMRDRVLAETRRVLGGAWEPTDDGPLPFSAGITTGPVLLERESDSGSYSASGAPITLAGRLKDAAPPGGILVAHETFTLVRGVFTFTQGEPLRVRGRKDPIEVYLVTQVKPRAFRLRAQGIEGVETKMIGREIELRLLQEALTLTLEDGETQVVTVVGEAGVGKSRLLFEFSNWTDLQEQTIWFFQARATQPSMLEPYSLARDLFSFRFRILDSDPLAVVHEKFVKGVEEFLGKGSERKAHFIGQLVGFDFSSKPEMEAALKDGDAFRRVAQGYMGELFTTASKVHPVMIHIEDIHWADDRSLDLVNNLVRDNTGLPLFVLCMARPSLYERRPQWGEGQRFHERIQLEPLSQLSSRRLVRELLKHVPEVPTALRDLVVDRADGNPFYIEELIKALIDDRVILKGEETWSVDTTRLSTVRVPATLTGVLQARLDTLPAQLYQLLQRVSVVGRIFWDAAAIHLSREAGGLKPAEVQAMLEDLRDREMILQREESGFAGTVEFVFRHAILRDVTYETVIPRQRRALHRLVGDWLIEIGGERAGEHTLLVAEHYSRAEEASLAAAQLGKAGERALQLAAYEEAATLLQRAKEILTGAEHTEQRHRIELLRANLESIRGHYAKAVEILKPTLEEARTTGDVRLLANVLGQLGRIAMWQTDEAAAVNYIGEALELSRKTGNKDDLIFNLRQMGNVVVQTNPKESIRYQEESVDLARQVGDKHSEAHGLNSLAIAFQLDGNPDKAMATFAESLQLNRERGDRLNEAMVLGNMAGLYSIGGDLGTAERTAKESMAIAKEIGAISVLPTSQATLAEICLRGGRDAEARVWVRTAVETMQSMGVAPSQSAIMYGILKIRSGDRPKGLAWIGFARAHDPNKMETAAILRSFWDVIRGDASEDEVEAALRAGEGLKLEDILAEAEREGA
ncbi:MAG TPA: protein kinase [Candidatus Limnocylindrales bacterium]|nr:protein kinase [Candidatus Limnocylindrales bacterium]